MVASQSHVRAVRPAARAELTTQLGIPLSSQRDSQGPFRVESRKRLITNQKTRTRFFVTENRANRFFISVREQNGHTVDRFCGNINSCARFSPLQAPADAHGLVELAPAHASTPDRRHPPHHAVARLSAPRLPG